MVWAVSIHVIFSPLTGVTSPRVVQIRVSPLASAGEGANAPGQPSYSLVQPPEGAGETSAGSLGECFGRQSRINPGVGAFGVKLYVMVRMLPIALP